MKVLESVEQIEDARRELRRVNASRLRPSSRLGRKILDLGLYPGIHIGDYRKSWDLLETIRFLLDHTGRHAAILDLGAFGSELPQSLHALGFRNLHGIDFNPMITRMRDAGVIRYRVGNFLQSPYADETFDAVTAISVIEHGLDRARLLNEISRILRPGGRFVFSFDYWPEKIDTTGIKFFDVDWTIFSREEVMELERDAETAGLRPIHSVYPDASKPVIHVAGKHYTFGWHVLMKGN